MSLARALARLCREPFGGYTLETAGRLTLDQLALLMEEDRGDGGPGEALPEPRQVFCEQLRLSKVPDYLWPQLWAAHLDRMKVLDPDYYAALVSHGAAEPD